jgi:diguanylate cyclase (GGDEF)-like protein
MNSHPESASKEDILVVDDTPNNLLLLSKILREKGYKVRSVTNGQMALLAVQASPPGLILLDINMPNMNGYEVCQKLKQDRYTQAIPVIFVSAISEVLDKVKAFDVGGVDYITKPFHQEEVIARVEHQLTIRRLQQRLQDQNALLQREINEHKLAKAAAQRANQELQRLASLDGLTQVVNRRRFDEFLHQEWLRAIAERSDLALIMCDVDYFKLYNDTYGHQAGDDCLKQVATAISSVARRLSDLVARYGGEEFVVILPNTDAQSALVIAETIRQTILNLEIIHARSAVSDRVTLSLGVASLVPSLELSPAILLTLTDKALYAAKEKGRNCIVSHEF